MHSLIAPAVCLVCRRTPLHAERATWTTCQRCEASLRELLAEVQQLWPTLPDHLEPTRGHSGPRVSGNTRTAGSIPAVQAVLDLIGPGGVPDRIHRQYALLCHARGLAPGRPAVGAALRLGVALRGLREHLPWGVQGADLAELHAELRRLVGEMRSATAAGAEPTTQVLGMPCPAVYDDGTVCGGQLRYHRQHRTVRCDDCQCVLDPSQWLAYAVTLAGRDPEEPHSPETWVAAAHG